MAEKARRRRRYQLFDRDVNEPAAVARVKGEPLEPPTTCRYCQGQVELVNNAQFYGGKPFGWPLAYCCSGCGARVGTHDGTDIPLGTLANPATMKARRQAHAAFDALHNGRTAWDRTQGYRMLARLLGRREVHIAWLDEAECKRVVEFCEDGAIMPGVMQRGGARL